MSVLCAVGSADEDELVTLGTPVAGQVVTGFHVSAGAACTVVLAHQLIGGDGTAAVNLVPVVFAAAGHSPFLPVAGVKIPAGHELIVLVLAAEAAIDLTAYVNLVNSVGC